MLLAASRRARCEVRHSPVERQGLLASDLLRSVAAPSRRSPPMPKSKAGNGYPIEAAAILRDLHAGMHDRINRHDPRFGRGRKWSTDYQINLRRCAEGERVRRGPCRRSRQPAGDAGTAATLRVDLNPRRARDPGLYSKRAA